MRYICEWVPYCDRPAVTSIVHNYTSREGRVPILTYFHLCAEHYDKKVELIKIIRAESSGLMCGYEI
jgi:hypothetical protein